MFLPCPGSISAGDAYVFRTVLWFRFPSENVQCAVHTVVHSSIERKRVCVPYWQADSNSEVIFLLGFGKCDVAPRAKSTL